MHKEKIDSILYSVIEKYKKHFDVFGCIKIDSLPFSVLDKETLEQNGIFLIADLCNFDYSKITDKYYFRSRMYHISVVLNQYFYRTMFPDNCKIDFLTRLEKRISRISYFPGSYLSLSIGQSFSISVRLYNCLKNASIFKFSDLVDFYSKYSIMSIQNFGKKTAIELCEVLEDLILLVQESVDPYELALYSEEFNKGNNCDVSAKKAFNADIFELLAAQSDKFLSSPIDVDLSDVRLVNCLKRANIVTYGDLLNVTEEDLYKIPNMGKKTIKKLFKIVRDRISLDNDPSIIEKDVNYDKVITRLKNGCKVVGSVSEISFKSFFRDVAAELMECLTSCNCNLTTREKDVLIKRNSLDNPMTLEEVARCYNLTRERIRQIESKANKKISSYFSKINIKYEDDINNFYGLFLKVDSSDLAAFCFFLYSEENVLSRIVESSLISKLDDDAQKLFSLKNKDLFYFKAFNSDFAEMFSKESKFLKCVENSESMKDIDQALIDKMDSGIKADHDVYRFIQKIKIKPSKTYRIIPYPLIENYSCDFALVIEERLVILISLFEDVPHLICDESIKKYEAFKKYCLENGFGCAWCTPYIASIHSMITADLSPKRSQKILSIMLSEGKDYFIYSHFYRKCNYSDEVIGSTLIQNRYKIKLNPSRVIINENSIEEFIESEIDEYDEIKSHQFTQVEKNVFLGFLELEKKYSRSERKKIYFGMLRVFLTGYQESHLYEKCKDYKYFGVEKNIKPSELKNVINTLVKLDLIREGLSYYGKTYYSSNGKIISASRVLNKLLGIADSLDDYIYDMFDEDDDYLLEDDD